MNMEYKEWKNPQSNNEERSLNSAEKDIRRIVSAIQTYTGIINLNKHNLENKTGTQEEIAEWRNIIAKNQAKIDGLMEEKMRLLKYNDLIKANDGDELLTATKIEAMSYAEKQNYIINEQDEVVGEPETEEENSIHTFDKEGGLSRIKR